MRLKPESVQCMSESVTVYGTTRETGLHALAAAVNALEATGGRQIAVSVSAEYHNYSGGAHGNIILLSWNFDLDSGTFFDAATLDDDAGFHAAVVQALKRQARDRAQENGLSPTDFFWGDYEEILENWTSYAVSFDAEGMTVAFSPYELACYAAGEQVFHLTYEELLPHMGPHGRALLGLEEETEEASEK